MTLQEKVLIVLIAALLLYGISLEVEAGELKDERIGVNLKLIHPTKGVTVNVIYRSKPTYKENHYLCEFDAAWLESTRPGYTHTCTVEE